MNTFTQLNQIIISHIHRSCFVISVTYSHIMFYYICDILNIIIMFYHVRIRIKFTDALLDTWDGGGGVRQWQENIFLSEFQTNVFFVEERKCQILLCACPFILVNIFFHLFRNQTFFGRYFHQTFFQFLWRHTCFHIFLLVTPPPPPPRPLISNGEFRYIQLFSIPHSNDHRLHILTLHCVDSQQM